MRDVSVCFAILAHDCPQCVADLVASIRHFCPGALPVVYNGSSNRGLFRRVDVPVCPSSRPLSWGHTAGYVLDTMMWVVEERWAFDFFVVLDSDMLLVNPGYEAFLQREMGDSEYMAVDFRPAVEPDTDWRPGQEAWAEWSTWGPLLGAEVPSGAFNPGQAFRRSLVMRIVEHPRRGAIWQAMETSKAVPLDEIPGPAPRQVGRPDGRPTGVCRGWPRRA